MRYANRVKQTTRTTGTGPYELDGSVIGFRTFLQGVGVGGTCYYCVTDGKNWEIAQGTVQLDEEYYDTAKPVMTRDTIEHSTNNNLPVNWLYSTRPLEIFVVMSEGMFQSIDATIDGLIDMVKDHPDMVEAISGRLTEIDNRLNIRVDGKSAYELAVEGGFNGTTSEWLNSLKGEPGTKGDTGVGIGIPAGGSLNQILVKASDGDHDTKWMNTPSTGSGLPTNWNDSPTVSGNGIVGMNVFNQTSGSYVSEPLTLRLSAHLFSSVVNLRKLSFEVISTGFPGDTAKVGIWTYATEHSTGALLAESMPIDISTTGVKTYALPSVVTLQPGVYWVGLITDSGTSILRAYEAAQGNLVAGGVNIKGQGVNGLRIDLTDWNDVSFDTLPNEGTPTTLKGSYVVLMNAKDYQ